MPNQSTQTNPTLTTASVKFSGLGIEGQEADDYELVERVSQGIVELKAKLAPSMQAAACEQLHKLFNGQINSDQAVDALASMVDISVGMLKRENTNTAG